MRDLRICLCLLMASFLCILASCSKTNNEAHYGIIAHQGYWKASEGAGNSIRGLEEASRLGIAGVELDVRCSSDGIPVLSHDETHGRYTIADTRFEQLREIRLSDGSLIPSLEEYLSAAVKFSNMILFIEPKTIDCTEKIIELVLKAGLRERVVITTGFDIHAYKEKGLRVYYMSSMKSPAELLAEGYDGISCSISAYESDPLLLEGARKLGLKTCAWVVKSESEMIWCASRPIDFVITDSPLECKMFVGR